jgi:LDH2 family malate/lactate/ureidoglycolate dehydrogenase
MGCAHLLRPRRAPGGGFTEPGWWWLASRTISARPPGGPRRCAAAGQIGLVFCNASPIVPPWQGREGRIGTNPICMSVPGPWLLDMATTTVAAGKIFKAFINDKPEIPAGWAFDSRGVPTTDTKAAYNQGMLMPLGGYKGSGLG